MMIDPFSAWSRMSSTVLDRQSANERYWASASIEF